MQLFFDRNEITFSLILSKVDPIPQNFDIACRKVLYTNMAHKHKQHVSTRVTLAKPTEREQCGDGSSFKTKPFDL